MTVRALLLPALALAIACSDPPVEDRGTGDGAADAGVGGDDATVDGAADSGDVVVSDWSGGGDGAIDVAQDLQGGDAAGDADAGMGGSDGGDTASDAASDTAGDASDDADVATDATAPDPCGVCPFAKQPAAPHPGGKGPHALLEPKKLAYGSAFGEGYMEMLVFTPLVAGPHPVLLFVPGKSLYATGGIIGELGHAYRALCEHVAGFGYIVAFVRVEQGLTDGDHSRMANDLLKAQAKLFATVSTADPTRLAYAGHSMGAKVAVIAAANAIAGDKAGTHADPKLVVAMNLSNEKPPLGVYLDASKKAEEIGATTPIFFDFITTADDTIAPLDEAGKPNSKAVYDALKVATKQIIVLNGTGKDDPNPATKPELVDDHAAPLTVVGKVGGLADFAMPPSNLDALDWYGYWKHLVGALNYHFYKGDPVYAYGALRSHGGATTEGAVITHTVAAQGWQTLP